MIVTSEISNVLLKKQRLYQNKNKLYSKVPRRFQTMCLLSVFQFYLLKEQHQEYTIFTDTFTMPVISFSVLQTH